MVFEKCRRFVHGLFAEVVYFFGNRSLAIVFMWWNCFNFGWNFTYK